MTSNTDYYDGDTSTSDPFDDMWNEKTQSEKELRDAYYSNDDTYPEE